MDSDSDIEIVEPVNKKGKDWNRVFPTIPSVKEAENRAHEKACKDKDCKRCLYIRNTEKWQHKLPIVHGEFQAEDLPMKYTTESWLDDRVDSKNGTWGLGCICCEAQLQEKGRTSPSESRGFAKFMCGSVNFGTLIRHHNLAAHVEAARAYVGLGQAASLISAPTVDDFECVWKTVVQKKAAPWGGIDGIGGGKKIARMVRCIAEGIRIQDRAFLKDAKRFSLARDERNRRLASHYVAVNASMERRTGLFMSLRGCSDSPGDATATYITRTTMTGFDRMATPKVNIRTDLAQEPMDKTFRKHLVKIWGSLVTDAAANELLSATDTAQKVETIDKSHASRRLLSRTLKLDDYMNGVLETMIVGKGSLCSLIQFSPNLREVFTSNVASMKEDADAQAQGDEGGYSDEDGDEVDKAVNIGIAKHRFDSMSKRLRRAVKKIEAMIATADWAILFRKGKKECRCAQRFEDVLDDECYMTLAFMAEAAQECCEFTRCFDSASMDTSIMIDEVNKFVERLDFLFVKGG